MRLPKVTLLRGVVALSLLWLVLIGVFARAPWGDPPIELWLGPPAILLLGVLMLKWRQPEPVRPQHRRRRRRSRPRTGSRYRLW